MSVVNVIARHSWGPPSLSPRLVVIIEDLLLSQDAQPSGYLEQRDRTEETGKEGDARGHLLAVGTGCHEGGCSGGV